MKEDFDSLKTAFDNLPDNSAQKNAIIAALDGDAVYMESIEDLQEFLSDKNANQKAAIMASIKA